MYASTEGNQITSSDFLDFPVGHLDSGVWDCSLPQKEPTGLGRGLSDCQATGKRRQLQDQLVGAAFPFPLHSSGW